MAANIEAKICVTIDIYSKCAICQEFIDLNEAFAVPPCGHVLHLDVNLWKLFYKYMSLALTGKWRMLYRTLVDPAYDEQGNPGCDNTNRQDLPIL